MPTFGIRTKINWKLERQAARRKFGYKGNLLSGRRPSWEVVLHAFPMGTFSINVTGSFLIGVLMVFLVNRPSINTNWRLFLVTGY